MRSSLYRSTLTVLQAFQMRGGPHDGVEFDPDPAGPHPDSPFQISFDDGSAYARTGEQMIDGNGQNREVFCFDADGSLTERAREVREAGLDVLATDVVNSRVSAYTAGSTDSSGGSASGESSTTTSPWITRSVGRRIGQRRVSGRSTNA